MFEKEIHFITDFNLNKIKTLGQSFTLNELFNVDLHPSLIKYISGRLDYMIYEERKILLENSRFDYSGYKIADYFALIAEEIKKSKKLSYSETEELIKKGVVFNTNYCVQPKSTLANLIFKESGSSKSTAEIKVYLNYLYYYDYYREIFNSYISKRKIISLTKDEFRNILDKADNLLMSSRREEILADALKSISDFYNDGGISKSALQPVFVEAYLKEKNLDGILENFHRNVKDNKKKIDIVELKRILFSQLVVKEEETDIEAVTEEANIEPDVTDKILEEMELREEKYEEFQEWKEENKIENADKEEVNIEKEKEEDENLPGGGGGVLKTDNAINDKNKKVFSGTENYGNDEETEKEETILEEEILDSNTPEDEFEMEEVVEEDISGKMNNIREKDIFSYLTQKDMDKIISSVFNDAEDDFANTLEKISECRDYEHAAEILKSVFFTYGVNPYKREAVSLTNAVSNYFHQG